MAMTRHLQQLDEQGYTVFDQLVQPTDLAVIAKRVHELFELEGELAGSEFKQEQGARRLANLVNKGDVFLDVVEQPEVLDCVAAVLGPEFKLSSLNARSANAASDNPQPLHCDMAAVPDERGYWVCNAVWMIDDFTPENGALRVVPGSHRWHQLPHEVMDNVHAEHPDQVLVTGRAGTVAVINAHLWHGGTANRTSKPRTAVHSFYCRRDKPQQQYQKSLLDPELVQRLTPEQCHLLAINDPQNDELSHNPTTRSGFLK